jgi:hypothetical protein
LGPDPGPADELPFGRVFGLEAPKLANVPVEMLTPDTAFA